MEFHVRLGENRIDLGAVEDALQSLDPAALADLDLATRTLRVSTSLDEARIAACLARTGFAVDAGAIERQPSTCWGVAEAERPQATSRRARDVLPWPGCGLVHVGAARQRCSRPATAPGWCARR